MNPGVIGACIGLAVGGTCAAQVAAQERAVAIQWEGIGLVSGTVVADDPASGRLRIFLTNPDRECIGTLSNPAAEGAWAIACPDATTASGRFAGRGQGRGGDGTGVDNRGRKITFVVAPGNQAAAAATPAQQAPAAPPTDPYAKQAPAVAAAAPAPRAPAPATAAPATPAPGLGTEADNVVGCGFLKLDGLPVRKPSIKCETSKRTANNGGDVEIAGLTVRLNPNDSYLRFYAEKDISGYGWRPMGAERIREDAERWASKYKPRNMTAVIGSSFRLVKVNITDGRDLACAYGNFVGTKMARGAGEAQHHTWVTYCEFGTHTVSDENIGRVRAALEFK